MFLVVVVVAVAVAAAVVCLLVCLLVCLFVAVVGEEERPTAGSASCVSTMVWVSIGAPFRGTDLFPVPDRVCLALALLWWVGLRKKVPGMCV